MHSVGDRVNGGALRDIRRAAPDSVPTLRRALTDFAREAGAEARQCQAVALATSEAVTNVVLHAYDEDGGPIHVTAEVSGGEIWISIGDDGRGLNAPSRRPGLGQGLALIGAVADAVAIVSRPTGGTELRLRFRLQAARASSPRRLVALPGVLEVAQAAG